MTANSKPLDLQAFSAAMHNYQHLTQDKRFASRVKDGKIQLVRVEYDTKGRSTVTPCSRWVKVQNWLSFMDRLCAF